MTMLSEEELKEMRRKIAPWWVPETQSLMQMFLAASAVYLVYYIVVRLLAEGGLKIDASVRDLVVFILGIIFGVFKDAYCYNFCSSAGQRKQGEAITKSLEDKDKIIATNATTAADTANAAVAAAAVVTATSVTEPSAVAETPHKPETANVTQPKKGS